MDNVLRAYSRKQYRCLQLYLLRTLTETMDFVHTFVDNTKEQARQSKVIIIFIFKCFVFLIVIINSLKAVFR